VACTTNQQINALTVDEQNLLPEFFYWYFVSPEGQRQVIENSSATTLPILNKSKFEALPAPIPPLAEQHQIVAEVERRLSIVAGAEAQVDANLRRADRLRQSILKQAFSGQLVPQDSNDEPASVLLERIRNGVGAQFIAPKTAPNPAPKSRPTTPRRTQSIAPLQETPSKPAASDSFASLDAALTAILDRMQPGREYSRADLADALGLSVGRWNVAIQELKRRGQVRQEGEKRGTKYSLLQ
jgi:type I restriction enzyme S subunit